MTTKTKFQKKCPSGSHACQSHYAMIRLCNLYMCTVDVTQSNHLALSRGNCHSIRWEYSSSLRCV